MIKNKNVNIIVNVDPRDIAEELWKLIQNRLSKNSTRRFLHTSKHLGELRKIVQPLVTTKPSHGGSLKASVQEVADELDDVAREALIKDDPVRDPIELEILARGIVGDMMALLKKIFRERKPETNDDEYLTLAVKIRKKELRNTISAMQR